MRFVAFLTIAAAVLIGPSALGATADTKDLVQATLLADVDSVKPGKPFNLAIHFKIKPQWHLYWKYPGDAGLPPRVKWKLPEGFTAADLRFPIPVKDDLPGGIVAYAYHDELLLTATITPPNNLDSGKPLTLGADLTWLVCRTEQCLPGKASGLTLDLPVGQAKPVNTALFDTWAQRCPRSPDQLAEFVKQTGALPGTDLGAFVQWRSAVKDVAWFPNPPNGSGVENLHETTPTNLLGNVSAVMFNLVPAPKFEAPMTFLVAFTGQDGKRAGVEFTVNLAPSANEKK